MHVRIAAIADTHFCYRSEDPDSRGDIADMLLMRTAATVNRVVKPHVTLVLGDVIADGEAADAAECLHRMCEMVQLIESPTIVVPGNHDGSVEAFYEVFARPPEFVDVEGVRFAPFIDPEEPEYNACRTEGDLARMGEARAGFEGPIVSVQHVPLFPPGMSDCPYNYTNAREVIAALRAHGYRLAISGHYHRGMGLLESEGVGFLAAPALCREPFPFLVITLEGEQVRVARHELGECGMPD
jgi:3',5'-cyclic AMP phosphodiesterase CpdA